MAALLKFVDLITVKVHDKDHSMGVTKGTCLRGGNFRSFSSLATEKVELSLNFSELQSDDFPDPAS